MKRLFWERLARLWILCIPLAVAGGIGYGGQAYNPQSVAITGGTISGVAISASTIPMSNVTGAGSMALQNDSAVAITGGTIDGTVIGGTTPAAGTFLGKTLGIQQSPGIIGEMLPGNGTVSLTTATYTNIASVNLTPGNWQVSGQAEFISGTGTTSVTNETAGFGLAPATYGVFFSTRIEAAHVISVSFPDSMAIPTQFMNISAPTTVYCTIYSVFTVSNLAGRCYIYALRVS